MFKTPDGSELKLHLASLTPQGPVSKKLYATPLSPSITEELSSDDDNAVVSTEYDELFAWLLQNKVDDEQIGNYLLLREITLSELVEFENEELQDLVKDIEKESKTKIQMIDKNRFIRACKKLRPQKPISNSIHQHSQPQTLDSHYKYQKFPLPPQHQHQQHQHQHQHLVNYPASQYNNAYTNNSQPQAQSQASHNAMTRHMSLGNHQSAYYAAPFNPQQPQQPQQPQPTYYNISPQPQQQPQQQPHRQTLFIKPRIISQANKILRKSMTNLNSISNGNINSRNHAHAFNEGNARLIDNVPLPLPDEYKSSSRSEFTTKDISDLELDIHEFDHDQDKIDKSQIVHVAMDHNHLNTKSSNLDFGGVEDSQHSAYYSLHSQSGGTGLPIPNHVNSNSHSNSHSNGYNASEDKFEQKVNMFRAEFEQVQNEALRKISLMSPSTASSLQPSVLHHPQMQVQANNNGNGDGNIDEVLVNNRDSRAISAISVMTDIPSVQHKTIFLQLARFNDKHNLKDELYSVITRLKKEIGEHQQRIDSFNRTLEKLKAKHAKQMNQWNKWYIVELKYLGNEYFNALFKFLSTQIQIEYTYIECFNEKLKSLSKAHNIVATKLEGWKMQKLQMFVKDIIVNVTKMKVSSTTISKKKALENMKQNIGSLQKEYESAKKLLASPKCDHTVRQQTIIYFFNTVPTDYNESNDNLVLTTTYFCEEHLQEKFNSFILDQRCQLYTMFVKNWLINIKKNQEKEKVTIKSIYQLIETLIIKFSKMYKLDQVTQSYVYYVERFAYICIISIPQIHQIFTVLLASVKGKKEYAKLANRHQYALFCKLLDAKYLSQNQ